MYGFRFWVLIVCVGYELYATDVHCYVYGDVWNRFVYGVMLGVM